jgi:hypothetical protein
MIMTSNNQTQILDQFIEAVNDDSFFAIADKVLLDVNDPIQIAKCAQLAIRREPGGGFYRARFWAKASSLIGVSTDDNEFRRLCTKVGVRPGKVKNYVEQGKAISNIETIEDVSLLKHAPMQIFDYAQKQNGQLVDYLSEALLVIRQSPEASPTSINNKWCQKHGSIKANLDIIKPSDWWAFSHPKWRKEDDFSGSIPGEIYANALYYFAPKEGVAVDPMAGSGMLKRVYDDRTLWEKDSAFRLEIQLFDLNPSRSYIKKHDAREPLFTKADWIFIDPPYFGQSNHLFDGDLAATKNYVDYITQLSNIVESMSMSLNPGGRLCLFLPKWSGLKQEDPNFNVPSDIHGHAIHNGLEWIDTAYVSRARQQEPGSATKNNSAKRIRRMRSDTCVLNVYEKPR